MWVEAHLESLKLCVFLVRNPRGSAPFTVHNRQETDQTTEPEERRRQPLTVLRLGSRRRQFSVGDNDPSHSFPTPRDITILKSPKVKQTMINSNTAKRLLASLRNSYTQWLVLFLKDAGGSNWRGMTQSPGSLDGQVLYLHVSYPKDKTDIHLLNQVQYLYFDVTK
jgi:hypothetical protein